MKYLIMLMLLLFPTSAHAEPKEMSVDQAYQVIPHQRTQYSATQSSLPENERKYLDHLFFVTDLALQKRIMMTQYFNKEQESYYLKTYNTEIGNMIASFDLIEAPTAVLQKIEDTIVTAIRQQQKFFNNWAESKGTAKYDSLRQNGFATETMVISSHQNLITAYGMLKQAYPNEAAHNQQAFYDHLCALDFI